MDRLEAMLEGNEEGVRQHHVMSPSRESPFTMKTEGQGTAEMGELGQRQRAQQSTDKGARMTKAGS